MNLDAFTIRMNHPYMHGVYLALNAVADAYLLVDSPNCAFNLAENIMGNHDLRSTLLDAGGFHRVAHTGANVRHIALDRTPEISGRLDAILNSGRAGAVLVTAMPMAHVTGVQYDLLLRDARARQSTPIVDVPPLSLIGDWLDGYAETLAAVARGLDLSGGHPRAENVAVVGYMMDRGEEDHLGNLREFRRIVEDGLGLRLVSVWLGGGLYSELARAGTAGTIVSLPHGREAARVVAEKTGAALVETAPPFGLDGTVRWIRQVAEATGTTGRAREFIDRELAAVAPKFEWVVPHIFLGRRVGYAGDPHYLEVFRAFAGELGCEVTTEAVYARASHAEEIAPPAPLVEPRPPEFRDAFRLNDPETRPSLVVANSRAALFFQDEIPVVEFGYPSNHHHAMSDEPFLGFRGAACFAGRMANAIRGGY